jgi:hypothetical protein
MNKILCSLPIVLLSANLACASNAWGLYGAYWNASDADDTFGAGLKASIEMIEGVQFQLRGSYFDDLVDGDGARDVDLEVIPVEAGLALTYPVSDSVEWYGGGGLGYYFMDADSGRGPGVDPDDEIGFYFDLGVEWALRKSGASYGETAAKVFAELMYRFVDADNVKPTGGGGADDVELDGIGVNLGLLVSW